MSISDQITRLNNAKAAIKQAISNKGVEVSDEAKLDEYPALIDSIEVGGGADEFLATRTLDGTNMSYLFYCYPGSTLDVSNLDTSNVRSMNKMFAACIFTELDLSNFNTSSATYMTDMFSGCINLEKLNLSNFTAASINMSGMLQGCEKLYELRLDNCDNDTINKIITSEEFPTGAIEGVTRKIYCKEANTTGLTPPNGWIFDYIS